MTKALFGLGFSEVAACFLDNMPSGKIRAQLVKKAKSLINNPHPPGCKKLCGMKDNEPVWRIRSGDYRILYIVREIEVIVLDIGNRKEVYR
jgi:mRNA interferase RelE/StbE